MTCGIDDIEQTLFLGCSVTRFSCTLGFNEQPSEVTVSLVRDTCAADPLRPKIYYDLTQSVDQIRQEWLEADPGFYSFGDNQDESPRLGAPVYFRFGSFEFLGILQSWQKLNTHTDQDVYEVKLVSPVEILAGCQLILSDYVGPVRGFNIFNIYGFLEVFSPDSSAPVFIDSRFPQDGPLLGSLTNTFGGANVNSVGMTWNKIKDGIHLLTSSLTPTALLGYEEYNEVGRIVYYAGQTNAKFGLLPRDDVSLNIGLAFGLSSDLSYYSLDISELPNVPDDYRIPGPNISLLNLISQICNDFGFDFYIELLPVKQGTTLKKIIKIRVISRLIQPDTDIIQQFIDAVPEVLDSSFGKELRNENTTTFLVGGQKHSMLQITNGIPDPETDPEESWLSSNFNVEPSVRDYITPFFGLDPDGNAYVLHTVSGSHLVNFRPVANSIHSYLDYFINLQFRSHHNWKILGPLIVATGGVLPLTIGEMRAAETSYDSWTNYAQLRNTSINQVIENAGYKLDTILNPDFFNNPKAQARDLARLQSHEVIDQLAYELRGYHSMISDIYTESKRNFMVRVPWLKARYQIDSSTIAASVADLNIQYTDEPIDGAWTEAENILYLPNPSSYVDRLRLEDGKIRPFAAFDIVDPSGLNQNSYSTSQFDSDTSFAIDRYLVAGLPQTGILLYLSFQQQPTPVFLDRINLRSPRIVITFSQPLDFINDVDGSAFNQNGWNFALGQQIVALEQAMSKGSIEPELAYNILNPPVREPNHVAIAVKSNLHTYGPWKPDNIIESGPPGQIRFQKEDDIVPWTFGGYTAMNNVAQARANSYVSTMTEAEMGNVTVAGIPTVPLGSEIASLQGLTDSFYPANEHLFENRTLSFNFLSLSDVNNNNVNFIVPSINFGFWDGSYGPNLTNITVNLDDANVSTNYSFRTYTPKFGFMSRLNAQRIEQQTIFANQRQAQQRFLTENRRVQQSYLSEIRKIAKATNKAGGGDVRAKHGTPHSVLVAQSVPWDSNLVTGTGVGGAFFTGDGIYRRSIVATKDLFELQNQMYAYSGTGVGGQKIYYSGSGNGYDNIAIMSLDGLLRPVSMSGDGHLPQFAVTSTGSGVGRINTSLSIPPFGTGAANTKSDYYHSINLRFLNPLSNPSGYDFSDIRYKLPSGSTGLGHDIDLVARNTIIDFTGEFDSLIIPLTGDYSDDYRFPALKGPLVMQGWGYDTNGKPIPNAADIELATASGIFTTSGLTDQFLSGFLRKSHTWPVAPIDLRFDRERNLWVSPPPYQLVVATLSGDIEPYGTGLASINLSGLGAYNSTGGIVNSGIVQVKDLIGNSFSSESKVFAAYDNKNEIYNIIAAGGSGGGGSAEIQIVLIDQDISGSFDFDPYDTINSGNTSLPDGHTIIFQDPPDDNYNLNNVSGLNLFSYKPKILDLKYYQEITTATTGIVAGATTGTITLATGSSTVNNFYYGDTITITSGLASGQSRTIVHYSGSNYIATLNSGWDGSSPVAGLGTYSISSTIYEKLVTTEITSGTTHIYRYATIPVIYDDGKDFLLGEYARSDYADYPENASFPPTGLPTNYLKKRKRGIVIEGRLITALCKDLPPPDISGYY